MPWKFFPDYWLKNRESVETIAEKLSLSFFSAPDFRHGVCSIVY